MQWVRDMAKLAATGVLLFLGCASGPVFFNPDARVIAALEQKARGIGGYAQDVVVDGKTVKRLYVDFEKAGRPFFRFRVDHARAGERYVYIYNGDGVHDYHYYPDRNTARRTPADGAWNPGNYKKAPAALFNYTGAEVLGEATVLGRPCYLLGLPNQVLAVSRENGLTLAALPRLQDWDNAVYYEPVDVDVNDDVFRIPEGVRVVDQTTPFVP